MSYTYEDKLNFIVDIYCPIRKVSFETGMSWKTMLAQAAQETGWGEKILSGTNNIFNIKLDSKWKGKTKTFKVWEGKKSSGKYENSKFPVFDSLEEAIYDRVDFLKRNPRYSKLFSEGIIGNFEKEVQALEDAGYATHADEKTGELIYAKLLLGVFGPTMRKAIARAEEKANCVITVAIFKKGVSGESLTNTKVLIKTDNNNYINKNTNSKGIIEGITSNLNGSINFNVDNREFSYSVANKRKLAIEVNITNDKFVTKTVKHVTNENEKKNGSQKTETDNSKQSNANERDIEDEVVFNIKLVEGDTGKSIPNTTYYLEYKNNIKPHKTDSSGVESGIKADVSQSISVYLDDDGAKKQSIYSMAFPVTGDLNGQTKVLKIPVVTLQLKFIDKNKKPIPNYEFKTVYRGRTSETKKTNSTGKVIVKALAGQPLKIIHQTANKTSTNIVTDGSTEWTFDTSKLIKDSSSSASPASNASSSNPSSAQKPNGTKPNTLSLIDKGNVIRNDKITQKGPTHEVKTDQAKITIKFLDEATDKPLSGLTYWTQSTKYGKNPATTGSDGTRGRTHDSDVGISIVVLVNENGKEVKKGTIVANSDKNGVAYVYKAKKPEFEKGIITYNIYEDHQIIKYIPKSISLSNKQKYKYIYYERSGKKHYICTANWNSTKEKSKGKLLYSKPTHSGIIYDKNVSEGSTKRRVKYKNEDIAEYGDHPTLGKIWRLYTAGNTKIVLVEMPDSLNFNANSIKIAYNFSTTQRRYTSPGHLACFIGALAKVGTRITTTGSCFKEGSSFPSTAHNNGKSIDTIYLSNRSLQQTFITAMHKFGCNRQLRGRNTYKYKHTGDGGALHNSHLHSEFDESKVKVIYE